MSEPFDYSYFESLTLFFHFVLIENILCIFYVYSLGLVLYIIHMSYKYEIEDKKNDISN